MFSDSVYFWHERQVLLKPIFPWELVSLVTGGSPIETDAGWLVLSQWRRPHAEVLYLARSCSTRDDPTKVIGPSQRALLKPNENEREGYVPNVVYTCGALVHNGELIIPYAVADHCHWFRDRSPQGRAGRHELARSFRRMRIGNKRVAVLSPVAWRTPPRQYGAWENGGQQHQRGARSSWAGMWTYSREWRLGDARVLHAVIDRGYEENPAVDPKVAE